MVESFSAKLASLHKFISQEYLAKFLHYPHTTSLSFSSLFSLVYTHALTFQFCCSHIWHKIAFCQHCHCCCCSYNLIFIIIPRAASSCMFGALASMLWRERERAKRKNKWMETLDFLTTAPERHCFWETTDYGSSSRKKVERWAIGNVECCPVAVKQEAQSRGTLRREWVSGANM